MDIFILFFIFFFTVTIIYRFVPPTVITKTAAEHMSVLKYIELKTLDVRKL